MVLDHARVQNFALYRRVVVGVPLIYARGQSGTDHVPRWRVDNGELPQTPFIFDPDLERHRIEVGEAYRSSGAARCNANSLFLCDFYFSIKVQIVAVEGNHFPFLKFSQQRDLGFLRDAADRDVNMIILDVVAAVKRRMRLRFHVNHRAVQHVLPVVKRVPDLHNGLIITGPAFKR